MLKEEIRQNIDRADKLEALYRQQKPAFRIAMEELLPEIHHEPAAAFWKARLSKKEAAISWGRQSDWLLILFLGFIGGMLLKCADFFHLNHNQFYPKNLALIILSLPGFLLAMRSKIPAGKAIIPAIFLFAAAIYLNLIPGEPASSDSILLACLHMPALLWLMLAFLDIGGEWKNPDKGVDFIGFSAEWLVMTGLMVLAGGLFTGISISLFQAIGFNIEKYYFDYFGIFAGPALPVAAALLIKENPGFLKPIAPIIARIFSPLSLAILLIYLPAMLWSGRSPFTDRDFLLTFNLLLVGILALIFFSLPALKNSQSKKLVIGILLALAILTMLVNAVALAAISYRIFTWGFTANRLLALGSNILFFSNLSLIVYSLFKAIRQPEKEAGAEKAIMSFLPVWGIWITFVVFLLPIIFGFK